MNQNKLIPPQTLAKTLSYLEGCGLPVKNDATALNAWNAYLNSQSERLCYVSEAHLSEACNALVRAYRTGVFGYVVTVEDLVEQVIKVHAKVVLDAGMPVVPDCVDAGVLPLWLRCRREALIRGASGEQAGVYATRRVKETSKEPKRLVKEK